MDDRAEADTRPEVAMQIEEKIIAEEKSNLAKLTIELRGVRGTLSRELLANKIKDCENKIAASETKIAELKKSGLSLAPG